ncbi:tripartite tricarboxylate transporter TctB family protein [Oceanobacillus longus]|uniref:Tripartite tricarboxylate transporter TctB family protein n=1 Tax=Oceanobacillus longus TaxID=930120 RepID=A0ABV8GXW5_9BACI
MNIRLANYLFTLSLILITIGYYLISINIKEGFDPSPIGPSYFPNLLSVILIIFCLISLFQTYRKKDKEKISLPNSKYVITTFIITVFFVLSWVYLGVFYLNLIIFLFALMMLYTKKYGRKKNIVINALIALFLTIMVYLIFGKILMITF